MGTNTANVVVNNGSVVVSGAASVPYGSYTFVAVTINSA
jgi:hypothetical protein